MTETQHRNLVKLGVIIIILFCIRGKHALGRVGSCDEEQVLLKFLWPILAAQIELREKTVLQIFCLYIHAKSKCMVCFV